MRIWLSAVLLAAGVLRAQDVGMGARTGGSQRFEAPYTLEISTPHTNWAKPLPGGPIRLLAVPTVDEGRTLVEIAQRLSLDLTTVSIDPEWDVNKWTMAFGKDYGARAEKGDLKLVYSYLEQELTSDKKFDAILLPVNHGWDALTPASRAALKRRVEEGCGLVLVHPEGELSPLVAADKDLKTESSPWRRTGRDYITRAISVETFPFGDVENYIYSAAPDAKTLIRTESGHPILAVREVGRGRVVAFGYRNQGLSWRMPMEARGHFVGPAWEYFYAMLVRSIIYAARREPAKPPNFDGKNVVWRVRDEYNVVRKTGRWAPPARGELPAGKYFFERQVGADWMISRWDEGAPIDISDIKAEPSIIAEGAVVRVTWKGAPGTAELVDGFDRVIARATGSGAVQLKAGRPLTHAGFVRLTSGTKIVKEPVRFVASSREWTDYEVIMPWYGPKSYQPWIPALDEQFRRIGITTLADPERNFKLMVSAHLPGFGIYWYRRDAYLERKAPTS